MNLHCIEVRRESCSQKQMALYRNLPRLVTHKQLLARSTFEDESLSHSGNMFQFVSNSAFDRKEVHPKGLLLSMA